MGSDLYSDRDPSDTISGLKFATAKDAEASVTKIKKSGRSHAHKVQAAVAMEQRAKAAGKKSAAGVYRSYINSVKKESVLRQYIRGLLNETYFPLEGGDKMRIHHSREGTRTGSEPQISGFSQKIGAKPNGLWYECQDGSSETWKDFCTTGMSSGYSKYDSTYNVVLNDYNILFIPDEYHFEKFYKMYSTNHPADPEGTKGFDKMIDWPKVASDYAGIEICPYLSSKRNDDDSFWYYGWDVASGCVWDPSGVKEVIQAGDCE